MSQIDEIIEGLTILKKYGADHLEPAHDQIVVCGAEDAMLSDVDADTLDKLGWFQSELYDNAWMKFT